MFSTFILPFLYTTLIADATLKVAQCLDLETNFILYFINPLKLHFLSDLNKIDILLDFCGDSTFQYT
ncbi:hypothetical protein BpHYR1_016787 [Brachionus plicatilis]|uniref:Uncharacterized protein n=1 Tax=Brachionus plicatilis TaxID=10195 RepID=A0A3M7RGD6_BRAPC|nr:hypothetical protein BpHYR1_016787 [Brachionus plicatilis]